MEVRQALADLAEVRNRLASVQRFEGYSGWAATASGLVALAAGIVQALIVPQPRSVAQHGLYLAIWMSCLAAGLAVNYGAIAAWHAHHRRPQARSQIRSVGMSILPGIAAGGVLTVALAERGLFDLLPGMWCATYALGLFASRAMIPRDVVYVAVGFGFIAAVLLLVPGISPLAWWVMPLVFGTGQIAIGIIVAGEPIVERTLTR